MIGVTGMGAVSAMGTGVDALFDGLCAGRCGIREPSRFGGSWPVATVPGGPHTTAELAWTAAAQALGDDRGRPGLAIVLATTSGEMHAGEAAFQAHLQGEGPSEGLVWQQLCHQPTALLRQRAQADGPVLTVSTACTSGTVALGLAADLIELGRAERVLVVGADALCRTTVFGFGVLGAASPTPCRPFDVERSGMSVGEGAAALVLERVEGARRPVLAHLLGHGTASDAHRMTAPDPAAGGAMRSMRAALGGIEGSRVGFVCGHGTGTPLNDAMEVIALSAITPDALLCGIKGAVGHCLGAAGTLEAVVAVQALRRGVVPPTVGTVEPIPGAAVASQPRPAGFDHALSVNFAFGGHCSAVLFGSAP